MQSYKRVVFNRSVYNVNRMFNSLNASTLGGKVSTFVSTFLYEAWLSDSWLWSTVELVKLLFTVVNS